MIVVDCVAFLVVLAKKLLPTSVNIPYLQLLATYQFGFAKRALIGTIISAVFDQVPFAALVVLGLSAWTITALLFVWAFKRIFGFGRQTLFLFACLFGSPFFLKNFMTTIGYFDIYGCMLAFGALLFPARWFYLPLVGIGCFTLILVHQIHFLLYIPTIAFIVAVRYYVLPGISRGMFVAGAALAVSIAALLLVVQFFGNVAVSRDVFEEYLRSRATVPINAHFAYIWYSTLADELEIKRISVGPGIRHILIFLALIALHLPIIVFFRNLVSSLRDPTHRVLVAIGTVGITFCYVPMIVIMTDYARLLSNWAVCMMLVMFATRLLPPKSADIIPSIDGAKRSNKVFGWILTAVPKVGITVPY
jgi:hypothetical protein